MKCLLIQSHLSGNSSTGCSVCNNIVCVVHTCMSRSNFIRILEQTNLLSKLICIGLSGWRSVRLIGEWRTLTQSQSTILPILNVPGRIPYTTRYWHNPRVCWTQPKTVAMQEKPILGSIVYTHRLRQRLSKRILRSSTTEYRLNKSLEYLMRPSGRAWLRQY